MNKVLPFEWQVFWLSCATWASWSNWARRELRDRRVYYSDRWQATRDSTSSPDRTNPRTSRSWTTNDNTSRSKRSEWIQCRRRRRTSRRTWSQWWRCRGRATIWSNEARRIRALGTWSRSSRHYCQSEVLLSSWLSSRSCPRGRGSLWCHRWLESCCRGSRPRLESTGLENTTHNIDLGIKNKNKIVLMDQ